MSVSRAKKTVRKVVVWITGFPIILLGIVLIPLPGPGVLVCLLGFFILSLEFEWAERYFDKAKSEIIRIYEAYKKKIDQ